MQTHEQRMMNQIGAVPNMSIIAALAAETPVPMILFCPRCGAQHIDQPNAERQWFNPPHRSHECQKCKCVWRPADICTTGVLAIETAGHVDTPMHISAPFTMHHLKALLKVKSTAFGLLDSTQVDHPQLDDVFDRAQWQALSEAMDEWELLA